jgi:two-component system sensor histidine kinase GlrK
VNRTTELPGVVGDTGEAGVALYRSTSIRQVVLIGFFVVTLPLIVAVITALVAVDRLTSQGQQAIVNATLAINTSRNLVEDVTAMERHARQFNVLGDPAIYQVYLERRRQFHRNAQLLSRPETLMPAHPDLDALLSDEQSLFDALRNVPPGSNRMTAAIDRFAALAVQARAIMAQNSELVAREAESIQQAAADARQWLLWLTLLLVLTALVMAAIFTGRITRPIRQMNQAIRRLGDGEFDGVIHVSGPDDLVNLGKRLEWLRRRLIQLEQQKINFLRHISHELKTPLASIREGAGLLKDRVVGPLNTEQAEVAHILQRNSLHLQRLIEDLIAFSVAERFEAVRERQLVSLEEVLRTLLHDQKLAAKAKNVSFELDLADVTVSGDREKLRIIFDNLLSNAIKYAPANGKVKVVLRSNDGYAVVDVRDNGPGIDADERERVFEAFYQGRALAKGHIKGSGLGLSIAYEYVKSHSGTIQSLDADTGAHLRVTLPGVVYALPRQGAADAIRA